MSSLAEREEELMAVLRGKVRVETSELVDKYKLIRESKTVRRRAQAVLETVAEKMPALSALYGRYALTTDNVRGFDDETQVTIPVGKSVRVIGHLLFGVSDHISSGLFITYEGREICLGNIYQDFLIEETEYSKQFVKLINSRVRVPRIPAELREQKFLETPILQMYRDNEKVPPAREFLGHGVIDFRIACITQTFEQMQKGLHRVTIIRNGADKFSIQFDCNLESWYKQLTESRHAENA